ncbi:hypothetical protein AB0I81_55015 [Nonomuraea sp. NPDC050404]|uniref:hypothetical protein n=1 Tax=Nonomuraea sp. NPDC050404 TaxID=3155783 RepID=UPI00340F95DE
MSDKPGFQAQHFSLNNPRGDGQGDVPNLLRRLAAALEEMGDVEIRDLVLHNDMDEDGDSWPYVTVYFDVVKDEEQPPDPYGLRT